MSLLWPVITISGNVISLQKELVVTAFITVISDILFAVLFLRDLTGHTDSQQKHITDPALDVETNMDVHVWVKEALLPSLYFVELRTGEGTGMFSSMPRDMQAFLFYPLLCFATPNSHFLSTPIITSILFPVGTVWLPRTYANKGEGVGTLPQN